ncbi:MAG: SDR family oxidoreductase [Planctomyces sp.]|nr:SDR family oxidoreductase [Planctomyces sp.]
MSNSRRIVITGATRGLGLAMTRRLIAAGHLVCGCGTSNQHVARLASGFPQEHRFDTVDVSSAGDVEKWSSEVLRNWGTPDLLINNAAIINENAPLWKISASEFDRLFAVNVSGTANTIRGFLPEMLKTGRGVIVNFSSGWGRSVAADVAPYCATKWAIEGLTQALAAELPSTMAAVPLNPGIINTEMLQSCFSNGASSFPSPEEWATRAVPFILSLNQTHNGQPVSVPER